MKTALLTLLLAALAATATAEPYKGKAFPRKEFEGFLAKLQQPDKLIGCHEGNGVHVCFSYAVSNEKAVGKWQLIHLDSEYWVVLDNRGDAEILPALTP